MLRPPQGRFSPSGWVDLARGTDPQVAAARELSGYYQLLTERDALAAMLGGPAERPGVKTPVGAPEGRKRRARKTDADRAQHLLALFAYHRDAPSVARALRLPLGALDAELEALGIRRRAYRIARGTDAQMPVARALGGRSGPPVRRRSAKASPPAALREIAVERGIARELKSIKERYRREALRRRWPRERIEQVLHRRDELRDLGVLDGLDREVAVRAGVIWTSLQGKRDALELF